MAVAMTDRDRRCAYCTAAGHWEWSLNGSIDAAIGGIDPSHETKASKEPMGHLWDDAEESP